MRFLTFRHVSHNVLSESVEPPRSGKRKTAHCGDKGAWKTEEKGESCGRRNHHFFRPVYELERGRRSPETVLTSHPK